MNLKKYDGRTVLSVWLVALLLVACGEKPDALLLSAKDYLAKNDNKAAVIQIKNALQVDPDLPEARFLLGATLLETGDPVGAELELRKALTLNYPQDKVVPVLAKSMLAQGQAKKVIDEFSRTELVEAQAKAGLKMALASAYAMQSKTALSQSALNSALLAEPDHPPALIAQARQKAGQRDFDGAMALADAVIAKSPKNHEAWKLKGDLYLHAKDKVDDALVAYRKAVEVKPDFLAGQAAVTTLLMQQGNLPGANLQIAQVKKFAPNHPQTQFLEAQVAYLSKDFKLSRDLVQQVLKASPNNIQGLQLAGAVELQFNSLVQAETYLGKALQASPDMALARRLLIVTYLRSGDPVKALAVLQPGLDRENVDPGLLAVAGDVYLQNGDVKNAARYFDKAARQNPKDNRSRTSLALTHLISGQDAAAFDELQDIALSDAGTSADMALIGVHFKRQEFDKALMAIDRLEKKQADRPVAAHLRATTLLAKRDLTGARKSFEKALAIDSSYFPAAASLAAMDMADGHAEDARKRFEAVLSRDPKSSKAWLALAEIASRTGAAKEEVAKLMGSAATANPADIAARLVLIDFHLHHKDNKQASAAAQSAVAALPDRPELLYALGRTQEATGDTNQAITTYNKLVNLQPSSPQPYMRLAAAHMMEKKTEAAVQSLRKALGLRPDFLEAQRALIALDVDGSRFQEALRTARTVQTQRPKETIGHVLEGDIQVAQRNWDDAAAAYRSGLKQGSLPELAIKLHSVLLGAGKEAEAEKFSVGWHRDHPKDALFLSYLGDRAVGRKDYVVAEKRFEAVVSLQPNNAIAYNNLAWVSAALNRQGALAFAEKANALAPNQPAFMDTLAMLLSQKGDYAGALGLQVKAMALQPENTLLKLNLAKIHLKGGKKDLARKELDELNKLGDKYAGQAEVASLLKAL